MRKSNPRAALNLSQRKSKSLPFARVSDVGRVRPPRKQSQRTSQKQITKETERMYSESLHGSVDDEMGLIGAVNLFFWLTLG